MTYIVSNLAQWKEGVNILGSNHSIQILIDRKHQDDFCFISTLSSWIIGQSIHCSLDGMVMYFRAFCIVCLSKSEERLSVITAV